MSDYSRNLGNPGGDYCDSLNPPDGYEEWTSPDWKGEGWYRLMNPAGTIIPEKLIVDWGYLATYLKLKHITFYNIFHCV